MLTSEDTELKGLLELDEAALTDLLASDYACARNFQRDEEARALSYLADMREVLRLESGAGVRVLRHWLDAACVNERLSRTNASIYGATALYDFARDRMADIALSDPVSHVRIQLEGARQWSRTGMQQEKRAGGSTGTGVARAGHARPAGPEVGQGRS